MRSLANIYLKTLVLAACLTASVQGAENTAITPEPRDAAWVKRHEGFVEIAKKGGVEVLFLGDSITDGWRSAPPNRGKAVWDKNFEQMKAANFGIGGDRTQHVLWRMQNGELEGIKPKAVVLMIGTNNTGRERGADKNTPGPVRNTTPEVIEGVTAVVNGLRKKLPESKILLLAIFPRGQKGDPIRDQLKEINTAIAKLHDGKMIHFLDIGDKFLEADGTLSKEIMPDLLHPNEKGYEIWADAIREPLAKLMK